MIDHALSVVAWFLGDQSGDGWWQYRPECSCGWRSLSQETERKAVRVWERHVALRARQDP